MTILQKFGKIHKQLEREPFDKFAETWILFIIASLENVTVMEQKTGSNFNMHHQF